MKCIMHIKLHIYERNFTFTTKPKETTYTYAVLVLNVSLSPLEYYNQIKLADPLIDVQEIPIFVDQEEFLLCL